MNTYTFLIGDAVVVVDEPTWDKAHQRVHKMGEFIHLESVTTADGVRHVAGDVRALDEDDEHAALLSAAVDAFITCGNSAGFAVAETVLLAYLPIDKPDGKCFDVPRHKLPALTDALRAATVYARGAGPSTPPRGKQWNAATRRAPD